MVAAGHVHHIPLLTEEDRPIDLSTVDPRGFASLIGSKVLFTTGVAKFLATDDILTSATIDRIDQSMRCDYTIPTGFAITSHRTGKGKNLNFHYYHLIADKREVDGSIIKVISLVRRADGLNPRLP